MNYPSKKYRRYYRHFFKLIKPVLVYAQRRVERKTDIFFISYPKSGRSWLRLMLGKYLCDQYEVPAKYMTQTFQLTAKAKVPLSIFSHDIINNRKSSYFLRDKSEYREKKVIFMTRNIKDVMVSLYFQATKRMSRYEGNISDFLWNWQSPVMRFLDFHKTWYENRDIPLDFLHLTYEGTQKDPEGTLIDILKFFGIEDIDQKLISSAVAFASFDNMKAIEQKGEIKDFRFQPGDIEDQESFKTRRGLVGGYVDYLSPQDIELIDILASKLGNPFVEY